jgi:hypothetical protein
MKSGIHSIQEFAAEIARRAETKKDFIANTKNVEMVPHAGAPTVGVGDMEFGINKIGHAQIAEVAKIPKQFYDRMLEDPDYQPVLCDTVNTIWRKQATKQLFRTQDGDLRCVRSDKFRTDMEYEDIAASLLPVLLAIDVDVMSCQVTDTRMYIKCVDKKVTRELAAIGGKFGDGKHNIVRCLSPAITISDSEVGYGGANVLTGLFDSFCSNLATFNERSVRKYHVGARHELVGEAHYTMLTDETKRKTQVATMAQLVDVTRAAFDRVQFDALACKVEGTQADKIESDDLVKVVNMAAKTFGLSEVEGKSVLKELASGGDLSRFGLYNAITAASANVEDYDRASDLERIGAQVIELQANQWKQIARAA